MRLRIAVNHVSKAELEWVSVTMYKRSAFVTSEAAEFVEPAGSPVDSMSWESLFTLTKVCHFYAKSRLRPPPTKTYTRNRNGSQ